MIFDLRPRDTAGPLRLGATGQDTHRVLHTRGTPLVNRRVRPAPRDRGLRRPETGRSIPTRAGAQGG